MIGAEARTEVWRLWGLDHSLITQRKADGLLSKEHFIA